MAPKGWILVVALAVLAFGPLLAEPARTRRPPLFEHSPANPALVPAIVPRGNLNPEGGHVRPVKHMYLDYVTPNNGGADSVDLYAMAPGRVAMVYHRQSSACLVPAPGSPCPDKPGARGVIDEYGVWLQHDYEVTSYYDHLHSLDPGLGMPDWRTPNEGWVTFGTMHIWIPGVNGAGPPTTLRAGERLGATRSYFHSWDIGLVDTRVLTSFLGSGVLRYPTLREIVTAFAREGGAASIPGPDEPFPGEMFANSGCFLDEMTPGLRLEWLPKLRGDGSCGRPDWDRAGTLLGNWFRSEIVAETLANITSIEANAISFSPYNLNPMHQAQIALGANYFAALPPTTDAAELSVRAALGRRVLITVDRAPGARRNPDPEFIGLGGYACYDVPDGPASRSLLVYHQSVAGTGHVRVLHRTDDCGTVLAKTTEKMLPGLPWNGDYVR